MPAKKTAKKSTAKKASKKVTTKAAKKTVAKKRTTTKKETPLEVQASFTRILLYIIALSIFIIFFLKPLFG